MKNSLYIHADIIRGIRYTLGIRIRYSQAVWMIIFLKCDPAHGDSRFLGWSSRLITVRVGQWREGWQKQINRAQEIFSICSIFQNALLGAMCMINNIQNDSLKTSKTLTCHWKNGFGLMTRAHHHWWKVAWPRAQWPAKHFRQVVEKTYETDLKKNYICRAHNWRWGMDITTGFGTPSRQRKYEQH